MPHRSLPHRATSRAVPLVKDLRMRAERLIYDVAGAANLDPERLVEIEKGGVATEVELHALAAALDVDPALLTAKV